MFIAVSGTFYATLAAAVPGTDPSAPEIRRFDALNPPPADASPELKAAAKVASTDAYHVAVLVAAALLISGAGSECGRASRTPNAKRAGRSRPAVGQLAERRTVSPRWARSEAAAATSDARSARPAQAAGAAGSTAA